MACVLSPKITGGLNVPLTELENREEGAILGEEIWGFTEFMGLVRNPCEDVQKTSDVQKCVSNMGSGRHLTIGVILPAA